MSVTVFPIIHFNCTSVEDRNSVKYWLQNFLPGFDCSPLIFSSFLEREIFCCEERDTSFCIDKALLGMAKVRDENKQSQTPECGEGGSENVDPKKK